MEEQHIFGEFGYFQVLYHKYQPTKVSKDLKPLPLIKRKSARLLSVTEQRNVTGTFLKDIRSFHDFQKHLHKKHMDINVVLFLSYACVNMNYLRNVG